MPPPPATPPALEDPANKRKDGTTKSNKRKDRTKDFNNSSKDKLLALKKRKIGANTIKLFDDLVNVITNLANTSSP